jgi:putative hydrolase
VAPNDPPADNDPFGNDPFGELSKLFGSLGLGGSPFGAASGDAWVTARQIAQGVANDGASEPNLDPLVRMAIIDLARVADLHIRQVPGIRLSSAVNVQPVSRTEWTNTSLDTYKPFFERFGEAVGSAGIDQVPADDPLGMMMGQMLGSLGPMMVAASAGSMIGHLGQRALGQYDLPVPRPGDNVLVIPTSIDAAAAEWDVPVDELRLVTLVHELAAHSVLSTPHVQKRLEALFLDFASAFRPNVELIGERFGNLTDLSQLAEISEQFSDPQALLDMMRSPAHDLLVPQLDALVAVVLGYVDNAVARACTSLTPNHDRIRLAMRDRITSVTPADRFMERLLGIDIDESTLERGDRFIAGVVDRAGDEGLERLWADELDLPTAAEVDAPGLWLARIGLDPDLPGGADLEIPDDISSLDDLD